MQYMLTPYAEPVEPFAWWEGAFNDKELDWLQERAIRADQRAQVGGGTDPEFLNKIRRSHVSWIDCDKDSEWVFSKLAHVSFSLLSQQLHLLLQSRSCGKTI